MKHTMRQITSADTRHLHPDDIRLRTCRPAASSYPVSELCGRSCTASRSSWAGSAWAPAGNSPAWSLRCPTSRTVDQRSLLTTNWGGGLQPRRSDSAGCRGGGCHISAEKQRCLVTVMTSHWAQRKAREQNKTPGAGCIICVTTYLQQFFSLIATICDKIDSPTMKSCRKCKTKYYKILITNLQNQAR